MHGLTVRWSLETAPDGVEKLLADYVADSSFDRFQGMPGLRFKTWRMRPGEWFEGCYVFESDAARDHFEREFREVRATATVSHIVGSVPVLIEPCEVVAVAEGGAGFAAAPRY